jgi:hypothetical protein
MPEIPTAHLSSEKREQLRRSFRPESVRVLFVGESPPAGDTFFYQKDSSLYRYTRDAFSTACGVAFGGSSSGFLDFYRRCGCYLDDLCLEPVNQLGYRERGKRCKEAVPDLAQRIKRTRPQAVIAVKSTLRNRVEQAVWLVRDFTGYRCTSCRSLRAAIRDASSPNWSTT